MTRRPETDIARPVVAWLRADGWTVYQEVEHREGIADIVATRGPLVWAIEVKTRLSLEVYAQARRWTAYAHLASVAVPPGRRRSRILEAVLAEHGIGVLLVSSEERIHQESAPTLRRSVGPSLRKALRPEQQTYSEAGSPTGARWTPWRATVRDLVEAVRLRPGITLREALEESRHHYSSSAVARASLARQIRSGLIEGLRLEQQGREVRVWPRERAA